MAKIKFGKYDIYIRQSTPNPDVKFEILGYANELPIIKKQEAKMINLVRQYNLTSIQKHLDNCIKRKEKRDRIMAQIEAIFKKEAIYIGHDKVKEVRVVIGRQLAYSRCCPDDTFDVSRGVAMCICDILNKKTIKGKMQINFMDLHASLIKNLKPLIPSYPPGGIVKVPDKDTKIPKKIKR